MIYKIFGWFFQQPVGGHYASYILLNLRYLTHPDVVPQTHWHLVHWHALVKIFASIGYSWQWWQWHGIWQIFSWCYFLQFHAVLLHWEELATFSFDDDSVVLSDGWSAEEAVLVLPWSFFRLKSFTISNSCFSNIL